ncbi:MAG: hypothetical protein ACI9XU_000117 [Arenicella sp.]|jgi:hypothetical protein
MIGRINRFNANVRRNVSSIPADRLIFLFALLVINIALAPLFQEGHIVFSDIAIGTSADRYLEEITGVWNQRWSTANFFNLSRLLFVAPLYAITQLTGGSGNTLVKLIIVALVNIAAVSFLILSQALNKQEDIIGKRDRHAIALACSAGAVFYALNPWLLTRIQHLYLLCGYALFPLVIYTALKLFSLRSPQQDQHSWWHISFATLMRSALFSLVFSVACASAHYAIYMLPVLAIVLIHSSLDAKNSPIVSIVLRQSIRLLLAISFFIVISFHWISPIIYGYMEGHAVGQNNVNVAETILMFSRNSDWLNTITGISYWWPMFSLEEFSTSFSVARVLILSLIFLGLVHWFKYSSKLLVVGSILIAIAATGAYYPQIAPWYVDFVLSNNNKLGFIFRDPNKLVGPLLLALAIFLYAGVLLLITALRRHVSAKIIPALYILLILVLFLYLAPFWRNYIVGFYAPVIIPPEYSQVQAELQKRMPKSGRVLYLPGADNMLQSGLGYSSLDWNNAQINGRSVAKASGSFTVFDSLVDTLYQHEGSPLSVDYFLNYLQDIMDKGSTRQLGNLISLTGATHVVYQSDFAGQSKRHAFNLDVLKNQQGLELEYENRIFSVFSVSNPLPRINQLSAVIHTPYGMNRLLLYKSMSQASLQDADVQFVSASSNINLDTIRSGDFMEVRKFDDWLLSGLSAESVIYPFDQVKEGNPFLKWSKTFASGQEWQYYLKRENITNFPFDFDYARGIVFSAVPTRLNIPPYSLGSVHGDETFTASFLADDPPAFRSLEPKKLKIKIQPEHSRSSSLNIIGEYIATVPGGSIIAAESRDIKVEQGTPYRLSFNLNTDGASRIQIQIVFMDQSGRKIGSEFVASSDASKRRHDLIPVGFAFVTPDQTARIKIELFTQRLKPIPTAWSIEELSLQSLSQFSGPNIITLDTEKFAGKSGQLYVRLFKSKAGGKVKLTTSGSSTVIDTFDPSRSSFVWVNAGHFSFAIQQNSLELENQKGLNAINAVALIDDETRQNKQQVLRKLFEKSRIFLSLDAEADFSGVGHRTDQRIYADLHGGKGFRSSGGALQTDFDIVKSSAYSLTIQAAIDPSPRLPEASIIDRASGQVIWSQELSASKGTQSLNLYSDNDQGNWDRPLSHIQPVNDVLALWKSDELNLSEGRYSLMLRLPKMQLLPLSWLPANAVDPLTTLLPQIGATQNNDPNRWSTLSSSRVPVKSKEQILLEVGFSSTLMKDVHLKIKSLDHAENELSVEYVNRAEWKLASGSFKVSEVITLSEGAKWAEIQVLGKQVQANSSLNLDYSSLTEYAALPLIDWILISEAESVLANVGSVKPQHIDYLNSSSGVYEIYNQPKIKGLKILESPSVLWQLETGDSRVKPFVVNGLSNAYLFETLSSDAVIRYIPEKIHRWGLYLLGLFLLIMSVSLGLGWKFRIRQS